MKMIFAIGAALAALSSCAGVSDVATEESDFDRAYVGVSAALALPQGGAQMRRVGGAWVRGGYYLTEFWALEGGVASCENLTGLSAQALWHWWGYERFDPFFTAGVQGWIGSSGQVGPKGGVGAFYHLTDVWSLRFDADATLGLDTGCDMTYTFGVGVQYSF